MKVTYYDEEEFFEDLEALDSKLAAKVIVAIEVVEEHGLRYTDSSCYKGDLFYLRVDQSSNNYRVFYKYDEKEKNVIVVSHGFIKKTNKTPKKEVTKARKRLNIK